MNKSLQFLGSMIIGAVLAAVVFFLVYSFWPTKSQDIAVVSPDDNGPILEPMSATEISQVYDSIDSPETQSPTSLIVQLLPSVERMDQQSLAELFEHISSKSTNRQHQTLEQIFIYRLAELEPQIAFETISSLDYFKQEQLIPTLMSRWATESLEDALSAASTLKGDLRMLALTSALSELNNAAHQQALEFAKGLGIEPKVKQALSEVRIRRAMPNPREAFEITLTDEVPDEDQLDLFDEVTELWLSTEGTDAFPRLLEILQTNSDPGGRSSWRYFYNLVSQLAKFDPPFTWELVENEYQDLRDSLRASILGRWVQIDVDGAQAALQKLDQDEYVEELYRDMIWYGMSDDPLHLVRQVDKFPQGHRGYLLSQAIFSLALDGDIDAAFDVLQQLEGLEVNTNRAIEMLVMGWNNHDLSAALDWVVENTEKGSDFQRSLLRSSIRDLAETDPERAIALAIEYDDPQNVGTWSSLPIVVIGRVAFKGDFETARDLLAQLGEPQTHLGHSEIGEQLVRNRRIDEAIDLGRELPNALQVQYFDNIAYQWVLVDADDFLDRFSTFSNELVQSAMANQALGRNNLRKLLSVEEIAYLEQFSTTEEEE
ncbi:MAG: hypothetical protein F4W92_04510 [Gammaproteobacteria bacterium]|nr:hypothetical protein [Gammaproteobacteria bacterium]